MSKEQWHRPLYDALIEQGHERERDRWKLAEQNKLLASAGERTEGLVKWKSGTLAHREGCRTCSECGQCWPDCQGNYQNFF